MPLTVGSRARPQARNSRGRPVRRQNQRQKDAASALAQLSEPGSAASNYSDRQTSPPKSIKKRKNKTIMMMEEMMQMVKNSEKRCLDMTEAVNKKLSELQDCAKSITRHTEGPPASTPNSSSINPTAVSRAYSQFDDDEMAWEGVPTPVVTKTKRRIKTTYQKHSDYRQDGAAGTRPAVNRDDSPDDAAYDVSMTRERRQLARDRQPSDATQTNQAADEALRLIAAAAQSKSVATDKKKGSSADFVFPYELVHRGDTGKKIKKGEASREEYVLGLIRLSTHPSFPTADIKALTIHQATIARDNCKLPWQLVRRYSEEIFSQIADGRLPQGWKETGAIDLIRIETIAMSNMDGNETGSTSKYTGRTAGDPKKQFDKASMGTPCIVWNRESSNCDKAQKGEKHGSGAQTYVHICGFCAYVRRVVANHPEHKCYSKKAREKQADQSEAQEL